MKIHDWPGLAEGETAWEGFTESEVIIQGPCGSCDHGLLLSPARFCTRCQGRGLITVRTEHRGPNGLG